MTRIRRLLTLSLLLLAAACAPQSGGGADGPRRQNNVITLEEIEASRDQNAYQLVQRLHPNWLVKRGERDLEADTDIIVYFDRARMGGPESLRGITLLNVGRIEYLPPIEALSRLGREHRNGAIVVTSR